MKHLRSIGLLTLAIVGGATAMAQTATTGSIDGTVLDSQSKKPVAGVSVQVVGQATRTTVTDANGNYRISLLNPGSYKLTLSKAGFSTSKNQAEVRVNQNTHLNSSLALEATTTVEVVSFAGGANAVDVTSSAISSTYTAEKVDLLPKGRNFSELVAFSAGVSADSEGNINMSGASGAENVYIIDGLNVTDMRRGASGASLPMDFVDQVEIQTGGFKPEYGALGGIINAVTKSGSNSFQGEVSFAWDPRNIRPHQRNTPSLTQDIYSTQAYSDRKELQMNVSGPIVKDKLFYFVGADVTKRELPPVGANMAFPELTNSAWTRDNKLAYLKLNWFITPNHQITASTQQGNNSNGFDHYYNGTVWQSTDKTVDFSHYDNGYQTKVVTNNYNLNYDWNISPTMFLAVKYGQSKATTTTEVTADKGTSMVVDQKYYDGTAFKGQPWIYGGAGDRVYKDGTSNKVIQADFSWFLGNHNLKMGLGQITSESVWEQYASNGYSIEITAEEGIKEYQHHYYSGGKSVTKSIYVQDTWEVFKGFQFSYGLRGETQVLKDTDGVIFQSFDKLGDQIQPRLGFAWDLNGDGKSKLTAAYAVYYEAVPLYGVTRYSGHETSIVDSYAYPTDANGNSIVPSSWYNTTTHTLGAGNPWRTDGLSPVERNVQSTDREPTVDGAKLPKRQEISLGYERQVIPELTLGATIKVRRMTNALEDSVITSPNGTPVEAGVGRGQWVPVLWNPGSSTVSWMHNGVRTNAGPESTGLFPEAYNEYRGLELTARYNHNLTSVNLNYTLSRSHGTYQGLISPGQVEANVLMDFDYNSMHANGPVPLDRTHVLKVQGSQRFNFGADSLDVGGTFALQTGTPMTYSDDGSVNNGYAPGYDWDQRLAGHAGTLTGQGTVARYVPNDPATWAALKANMVGGAFAAADASKVHALSTSRNNGYSSSDVWGYRWDNGGRLPTLMNLDLRIAYTKKLGGKMRLIPAAEIFNAFNSQTETGRNTSYTNASNIYYNTTTGIQLPRNYRFSVKFCF